MITVNLNNKVYSLSKETTLSEFVRELQIETQGIAIAINNQVIQRNRWETHFLKNNDNILIIKATQGG